MDIWSKVLITVPYLLSTIYISWPGPAARIMPLPLVGGTIWTEMGPQEEARVMKTYHVERTKNWTSLHSNWLMYISHCYKQCPCQSQKNTGLEMGSSVTKTGLELLILLLYLPRIGITVGYHRTWPKSAAGAEK